MSIFHDLAATDLAKNCTRQYEESEEDYFYRSYFRRAKELNRLRITKPKFRCHCRCDSAKTRCDRRMRYPCSGGVHSIYSYPNLSLRRERPCILSSNSFILAYGNHRKLFSNITLLILFIFIIFLTKRVQPVESFLIDSHYHPTTNRTGQYSIAQLCPRGSTIPVHRRVEGAALVSTHSDLNINCTITFRTKTAHQHFIVHFEDLKLGCDDYLRLFDQEGDYGQPSIKDYSCRDNMASVGDFRTSGTFLTIRYITDSSNQPGDGFRIVITAVFDDSHCPPEYAYCRDNYCISRLLFCDGIDHCLDKSDETGCHGQEDPNDLPHALGLLVVLVLAISACVMIFIATIHCRKDYPHSQYQNQLHQQQQIGIPLQASSSIMFPNHRTQFFQPAQMSPYVTPQHVARDGHTFPQQPIIVLYRNDLGNL